MDDSPASANKTAFRIVTMDDGSNDEWESCWWNVDFQALNHLAAPLTAPLLWIEVSLIHLPVLKPNFNSSLSKIENKILGVSQSNDHMDQSYRPIHIISYVIWNNYVILIGYFYARYHSAKLSEPFHHTMDIILLNRTNALDFTIFGNNLNITHTTGHFVWSFYGRTKSSHFAPNGSGLQTTSTQYIITCT